MKKSFLTIGLAVGISFFMQTDIRSQSCPNLNFSMGNFNYWSAYMGSWASGSVPCSATAGRHTIMDAQQLISNNQLYDEYCPVIPKVPPGYAYSAKLGNSNTNAELDGLEYTMIVDSNNSLLVVHFALVLQNFEHTFSGQPQFTMEIRDSLGRLLSSLPCNYMSFSAESGRPDLACDITGTQGFAAKNWTTAGFNLEPLIGQKIKIYFETRDCAETTHFGYAYLVAECMPMRIDLEFCTGQTVARMAGPVGFTWYKWTRNLHPSWSIEGNEKQARYIAVQDPLEGEIFTCELTSAFCDNWNTVEKVEIKRTNIDADFGYGIKNTNGHVPYWDWPHNGLENWYDTCARTATFVDFSTVMNSKKVGVLWEIFNPAGYMIGSSTDSLFTFTFPDPDSTPVTYRVRLTGFAENGCVDTSRNRPDQRITIYPSPKIRIDGTVNQLCEGDTAELNATAIWSEFVAYQWSWTDKDGIIQTATGDSLEIYSPGTYILVAQDTAGCYASDTFKVTPLKAKMILFVTDISCYGDNSGMFTHGPITGGQPPYQPFYWIFPDEDGYDTIYPGGYTYGVYMNLRAGIYRFEARDLYNCYILAEFEIKQPDSLKITGKQYPATCNLNNGSLKLTATGGLPPYHFEIKDKNDYSVPLITADSAANLSPGIYTIIVTDAIDDLPVYDKEDTTITRIPKRYSCTTSDTISVTALEPVKYTIQGQVFRDNSPLRGVTIRYLNDSILTNTVGEYIITNDGCTTVTLIPSLSGYSFTPDSITISNMASHFYGQNFIASTVGIGNYESQTTNNVVYPNPTTGKLSVVSSQLSEVGGEVKIYDVVGQVVGAYRIRPTEDEIVIDISHLSAGLYFLKVDGKVFKVVKE